MTARDLITAALKRLGVLAAGETAEAEDAADGLLRLNDLIDGWATERLTIYTRTRTTWTITANDGSYTVGATGDIVIARPVFVDAVSVIDTGEDPDLEMPLAQILDQDFARIPQRLLTSDYPSGYHYNPTYPNATLTLYPVPNQALQGAIYHPTAVAQLSTLDTSISLPPGYQRFLTANLAVELAPEFDLPVSAELRRSAVESKAAIKLANYRPFVMDLPGEMHADGYRYNIETDRP